LAPPERVWNLLTDPATYETWAEARVDAVDPPGRAQAGQRVHLSSGFLGLRVRVRFDVERVDEAARDLEFRGTFPLGVTLHEHISVRPVDGRSRVQYG
jgi:carbon monoxide dehydrogenase subunit G